MEFCMECYKAIAKTSFIGAFPIGMEFANNIWMLRKWETNPQTKCRFQLWFHIKTSELTKEYWHCLVCWYTYCLVCLIHILPCVFDKRTALCVCMCSGGCGRTGTFITVSILLEQLKTEKVVDVFHTVRGLRLQRPGMVQTVVSWEDTFLLVLLTTITLASSHRNSMNTVTRQFWSILTRFNSMQTSSS